MIDIYENRNYVKLVGVIKSIKFGTTPKNTKICNIILSIKTEFKSKPHPEMLIPVVAWDVLASNLENNDIIKDDTIHIEGRVTLRQNDGKTEFGVTANRIGVVRNIPDYEPYIEKVGEN